VRGQSGVAVPDGYRSGEFLSDESIYLDQTFATLGILEGTYIYRFGAGADADSFTVQIGPAVPEPGAARHWFRQPRVRAPPVLSALEVESNQRVLTRPTQPSHERVHLPGERGASHRPHSGAQSSLRRDRTEACSVTVRGSLGKLSSFIRGFHRAVAGACAFGTYGFD
jgi:hypothetical protein